MKRFLRLVITAVLSFIIVVLATILALQYFGVFDVKTVFHRDEVISGIDEVAATLSEKIEEGVDGSVTLYVSGVDEEELLKINYYIVTLNGSVNTITRYGEADDISRVVFDIVRSDNSYVYDCIVNGNPIPEDKESAKELYNKTKYILDNVISSGMSDYEKEKAIHDYIIANCEYGFGNTENDNEYRAYGAICDGNAVCNGYAEAMALLFSCAGIENEFITGYADDILHAWNLVKIDGQWYHLDATWDDPVSNENNQISYTYFNVTDDIMARRHTWNRSAYRKCTSMEANYFRRSNMYYQDYTSFVNDITCKAQVDKNAIIEVAISNYSTAEYNLDFIFNIQGVDTIKYSIDGGEDYTVLTIYLNR